MRGGLRTNAGRKQLNKDELKICKQIYLSKNLEGKIEQLQIPGIKSFSAKASAEPFFSFFSSSSINLAILKIYKNSSLLSNEKSEKTGGESLPLRCNHGFAAFSATPSPGGNSPKPP